MKTINNVVVGCVDIGSKQKGQAREMTASVALKTRGSCTSNCESHGSAIATNRIPARILSIYPTWVTAPYQTHHIIEAFVPGFGWYPIESAMYARGWPCNSMPIVSIVSIDNENKGKERLNGGGGVAYLSLTETRAGMPVRGSLPEPMAIIAPVLIRTSLRLTRNNGKMHRSDGPIGSTALGRRGQSLRAKAHASILPRDGCTPATSPHSNEPRESRFRSTRR